LPSDRFLVPSPRPWRMPIRSWSSGRRWRSCCSSASGSRAANGCQHRL